MALKKLKIAYVIPQFYPFQGGAENNMYAMASRIAALGADVTVFTTYKHFASEDLKYREVYNKTKIVRHMSFNNQLYLGFYPRLLIDLLVNNFDLIHTSGIGFIWREFCLVLKKLISPNTVFICTPHGPFMALGDTEGSRGFAKKYYTKVLRFILPTLYDSIIEINNKQKEWLESEYNYPKDKVFFVPNGIDTTYFENSIVKHAPQDPLVITYTNRHEWYKGIQDVIKACHLLKEIYANKQLNLLFYIMGRKGNYTSELEKLINELEADEYVKFIYSPTNDERDKILYEQSQIHIMPSKAENFGIVLIEAMAKGNVVICTTGNEAHDIVIKEGESGYTYNFGDYKKLAEIIQLLIEKPELREKIRTHNITFAKNFSWDKAFEHYQKLINQLC